MMISRIILVAIGLVSLIVLVLFVLQTPTRKNRLTIGETTFVVEIAQTPAQKRLGLGGRKSLEDKQGMVFSYRLAARYPFWMEGMLFDLDFVFVRDGQVIETMENIPRPQEGKSPTYAIASQPFTSVIELKAGTVKKYHLMTGDKVNFIN